MPNTEPDFALTCTTVRRIWPTEKKVKHPFYFLGPTNNFLKAVGNSPWCNGPLQCIQLTKTIWDEVGTALMTLLYALGEKNNHPFFAAGGRRKTGERITQGGAAEK